MAGLNLLPWREEARAKSKKQFVMATVASIAFGAVCTFGWYSFVDGQIEFQEEKNAYLKKEIRKIDKTIAEIKKLESTRTALLERIAVIDRLQSTRPGIVHLFDEMVKSLPRGLYITKLAQNGNTIKIEGKSESNARVSSYMDRLDSSPWLSSSNLETIAMDDKQKGDIRLRRFNLTVKQLLKPDTKEVVDGLTGTE
jgi:type IV pilus assembly protein PilN